MVLSLSHVWKALILKQATIFAWQLLLQALPIRKGLVRRGLLLINESCPLCNTMDEAVQHHFFALSNLLQYMV
uniref:Reverse transcriptase zinc-binding domain-containing protein n=1 Tax=Cajanus cajan TaxID=3821 RepID=A0A151SF01_CAJCA|nr:hypothetical protein KK1_024758 [Cajanus cajan]